MATDTANTVTFDEADETTRTKRPWHELYPDAKDYVDNVVKAFVANFGKESEGYARKLSNLNIPLERDSENPQARAVRLINDRCATLKVKCHAGIKAGNVHMFVGKKVVKPRTKRNGDGDANATDNGSDS